MNDELTNANERVDEGLKRNRPGKEPFRKISHLWSPIFPFSFPFSLLSPLFFLSRTQELTIRKNIYIYIYVCMRVNVIYLSYACVHVRIVTGMNRSEWRGECRPIRKGVVLNHVFFRSILHFHSANVSRRVVIFKEKKKKKSRSNRFFFP